MNKIVWLIILIVLSVAFNPKISAQEKYDSTVQFPNKEIESNLGDVETYKKQGPAYLEKCRYEFAANNYSKAIMTNPWFSGAYDARGFVSFKKGQYDRAINDYSKAIEVNPEYVDTYSRRGFAYVHESQYDRAISDYNRAVEISPENGFFYRQLGLIYLGAFRDKEKGCSELKRACELGDCYGYNYAKSVGDCK